MSTDGFIEGLSSSYTENNMRMVGRCEARHVEEKQEREHALPGEFSEKSTMRNDVNVKLISKGRNITKRRADDPQTALRGELESCDLRKSTDNLHTTASTSISSPVLRSHEHFPFELCFQFQLLRFTPRVWKTQNPHRSDVYLYCRYNLLILV